MTYDLKLQWSEFYVEEGDSLIPKPTEFRSMIMGFKYHLK